MSFLEDVFLHDEADEAQDLERIIEGDDFEQMRRSDDDDDSPREDEAEEDKRIVDPSQVKPKRVVKNPRFTLNPARLTGPRGIQVIPEHFKDLKFKGKGHEKEDLDLVLKKLEHWAYRLYPKFKFEDCLKKIEILGKKRPVMVHLHKIRSDQLMSDEPVIQSDSSDDEPVQQEPDEFDKLLQQQIAIARATPGPNSAKKPGFNIPEDNMSALTMPKVISSPSISDDQRERMMQNRKKAEERRLARLKQNNGDVVTPFNNNNTISEEKHKTQQELAKIQDADDNCEESLLVGKRKFNKSNVISSSDEECEIAAVNTSTVVDVHGENDGFSDNENYNCNEKVHNLAKESFIDSQEPNENYSIKEFGEEIEDIEMVDQQERNELEKIPFETNIGPRVYTDE